MTSLTIFSKDTFLQSAWQQYFPDTPIMVTTSVPEPEGVWVLDCAMLSRDIILEILAWQPKCCFALLDKETLSTYGALMMDAEIPILAAPLNQFGIYVIQDRLNLLNNRDAVLLDTRTESYSGLAREFAFHAQDPKQFIEKTARTVLDTMQAHWVGFLSISFDEIGDYTLDVLGMAGNINETSADKVIRPDGFTIHIMNTQLPVVMPNMETFRLDDIEMNPHIIKLGFKSGLGLPLLYGDGKPFGVMWVMYYETRKFSYGDVRHMQVYASHVALAHNYHVQKKLVTQWQKAAQRIFTRFEDVPSLDATLQHITEGIHESLDCDVVTLYLYHPSRDELDPPYDEGALKPEAIRIGDAVKRESIVYEMLDENTPLILENAPADERFAKTHFLTREGIQSVVVMPLKRASEKVGVVFLNYRHQRHFTDDEREAITLLADQIAVSILNARLDEEQRQTNQLIQEQGEQLQTMIKVIDVERNLNNQDRELILNTIASQTAEVADADRVTIRLVQGDHVAALAVYPKDDESLDAETSEDWEIREGGHSHYIVQTNQPVIIDDVDNYNPADYNGIPVNPKSGAVWKARIGLPLTSGENTIGVMWLSFKQPRKVTKSQLSAFQSFANIAFLTKMYDIEQERLQHALKIMSDAHQTINAAGETDDILRHTMELARQIVSSREVSSVCQSHLAIVSNQTLIFKPEHNNDAVYELLTKKLSADTCLSLDCDDPCLVAHVARDNETILVNDVSQDARFLPLLHDSHTGSQMSVPIRVGDKVFAVVSVEHIQPNSFEWYDKATLEWLASFVGQVLRNRKQQQMREALFEASQAITAGKDLQAVLETIAEQAHRVLQVKRGATDHDAYIGLRKNDKLIFLAAYPEGTLHSIRGAGLGEIDLMAEQIGISGLALANNKAVLVHNTYDDDQAFEVEGAAYPPLSLMSVPIPNLTEDEPALGVISLGHRDTYSFDDDDKQFMILFAKFAAVAIRRAREIDAQRIQRESFFELTHAAMDQVIAYHDLNNFRMIHNFEFAQLKTHVATLVAQEEKILKSMTDSQVFDDIEEAMDGVQENIANLDKAYSSLIERDTRVPELGDSGDFPLREWLWRYHQEKHIHLRIDESLTEGRRSLIPQHWLREVIKIVLTNARRGLKQSGYIKSDGNTSERLILMDVTYNRDTHMVDIRVSNPGDTVPEELRSLLTRRVIPKHLRDNNEGGRGIGLFMSGIIMRAYKGDIRYIHVENEPTFLLSVPVK